jgi:monoamine oxidase
VSKKPDFDLIIIGAGVAGLAAAASISQTKKSFLCLEATGRIGGRILTIHDPMAPLPIELGAEFIHGRPPEIWDLIRTRGLTAFEHASHGVHFDRGRIIDARQVGDLAATLLSRLAKSVSRKKHGHDRSFDEYIRQSRASLEQKDWAGREIEGFNAARKERISANSLGLDERAAERIDGNRAYRLVDGYHSVPVSLLRLVAGGQSAIQWNSIVECVNWRTRIGCSGLPFGIN